MRNAPATSSLTHDSRGAVVVAIIVTRNRLATVASTLAAIRGQTRPVDHILVVDNGSSDGSGDALAAAGFHILRQEANLGYGAGLAAGWRCIRELRPDFVLMSDDDSVPEEDAVAELLRVMTDHPELGIVGSGQGSNLPFGRSKWSSDPQDFGSRCSRHGELLCRAVLVDCALVRTSALMEVGPPRDDLFMMLEDVDLSLRLGKAGWRVAWSDRVGVARAHLGSTSPGYEARPWRAYYQARNHLRLALEYRSPRLITGVLLRELAFLRLDMRTPRQRGPRVRLRWEGYRDAVRGRMGRTLDPST